MIGRSLVTLLPTFHISYNKRQVIYETSEDYIAFHQFISLLIYCHQLLHSYLGQRQCIVINHHHHTHQHSHQEVAFDSTKMKVVAARVKYRFQLNYDYLPPKGKDGAEIACKLMKKRIRNILIIKRKGVGK